MRYAFIDAEKATETNPGVHSVALMCRVLGMSRSGYYAYLADRPAAEERARQVAELVAEIRHIHDVSRRAYGAPRITAVLRRNGHQVNHKRVERLMRECGISGITRRRRRGLTRADRKAAPSPDLVGRDFTATEPGTKLVSDITYLPTFDRLVVARHGDRPGHRWVTAVLLPGLLLVALTAAGCHLDHDHALDGGELAAWVDRLAREAHRRPARASPSGAQTSVRRGQRSRSQPDLSFLGLDDDLDNPVAITGYRAARGRRLTLAQKEANKLAARERAANGHGFADLKNWCVLTRLRLNARHATALLRSLLVLTRAEVSR
ncbi:IS3 family transposase [Streptomyces sp. NPDC020192]|uniref:IS3 family transposase n=1 Tax=Streptomyces sp. NPDC020192 TaxID=3365066 RepID=UPI0037930644